MTSQETKRKLLLAKEFAEVFRFHLFRPLNVKNLGHAYQATHKRNLSLRKFGYRNMDRFVDEMPIFAKDDKFVSLDRQGLITYLFQPVYEKLGPFASHQQLVHNFEACTGINIDAICDVLKLESVDILLSLLDSYRGKLDHVELLSVTSAAMANPHEVRTGQGQDTFENSDFLSLEVPPSVRSSGGGVGAMDPHSRHDQHIHVKLEPALASPRPPLLTSPYGGAPIDIPRQAHSSPSANPYFFPPHPPTSGVTHNTVPGYIHPTSPIHGHPMGLSRPPPPSTPTDPRRYIPPARDYPGHVAPQVISSQPPPPMARQRPPLTQDPTSTELSEKFPHPNVEHWRESVLPIHSAFRPDLPVPRLPPGATDLTTQKKKKKKETPDSKQKQIERVNAKVDDVISELASVGEFLLPNTVRTVMLELINKANRELPHNTARIYQGDITAYINYSKVHGRVDELIKVFCRCCPVTSLCELEQAIIESEKVESFEALRLGPVIKHPRVIDLFKLGAAPTLDAVPQVTSYKIHDYLMKYTKSKQRSAKYSVEEFLEYIRAREFAESVYHLCIRITSFPLAIQTNFRFRASQTQVRKRMEDARTEEMNALLKHETEKLRKKLSSAHADDPLSIRRDLGSKDPVQILMSIFSACTNYFKGPQQAKVGAFMQMVTEKPALRHLFLLAIYEGAYGADRLMPKFMEEHLPSQTAGVADQADLFLRPQGEVLQEIISRLRRALFPIDLGSLARIEGLIVDKYGAPSFDSLGNGSFLDFVSSHERVCDAIGGRLIGTNSSHSHVSQVKKKVMRIVHQLKFDKRDDQEAVSNCVTTQFGVDSFQDLGCGTVHKLLSESHDMQQVVQSSAIAYLSPLLLNSKDCLKESKQGVGVLGHQSREDALDCLQRAPLLEDLGEWSHWEMVFQPQYGKLEDFLQRETERRPHTAVHALEVAPGQLIRIDPNSSMSDFVTALTSDLPDPVNVAGHLVSLLVKRGSIRDISVQLLASHVTTCLEKLVASRSTIDEAHDSATVFVHHILIRIPFKLCKLLASEIFIDPLRKVSSSSTVDNMVNMCATLEHRRVLQALGMAIGVKAWADDYKTMLIEPHQRWRPSSSKLDPSGRLSPSVESPQLNDSTNEVKLDMPDIVSGVCPDDEPKTMETIEESDATISTEENTDEINSQSTEALEERKTRCKEVIQAIRHDEFGIGIDLDPQQQEVAAKQRQREGRGIKRLSLELYSKDTHFVLELIQNADDNDYHPSILSCQDLQGEVPSLKFIISGKAIVVLNNEVGFSEKNIRAICDVGKSTKGAHRFGYIGQKGIGFKSVFRVTDTPEIHSNGFHIGFDASTDPIGFILPHWIKDYQSDENIMWRTKIVLTLKESHLTSNMAKKFNDIQPSLLLFLHRLRSITVLDEVSGQERCMVRRDRLRGIVDIEHTNGSVQSTDRWLVVKKLLDKAYKFKSDVEVTELALAFPMSSNPDTVTLVKDLQQQQVFAFLPLRSYGFRFILQGDFELPSSREDVNSDSSWNQWLREEIPLLFMKALEKMKELPSMPAMQAVAQFLQFVPLEGELHDFFQPVTSQILNLIRGSDCLPSDPSGSSLHSSTTKSSFADLVALTSEQMLNDGGDVEWKQPSQLLFVKEKFTFIRQHISQALVMTSLNLSYLNSSLLPYINPSLQYQLGMSSITVDHLIETAQTVMKLYTDTPTDGGDNADSDESSDDDEIMEQETRVSGRSREMFVSWTANWLACVHMIMEDTNDLSTETIEKLKKFAILPLEDGTMTSTSEKAIFFPPDDGSGELETRSYSREFKSIFKEMSMVETALFEEGDALVQSRVRKVLELIGVRNLYPLDIIKHHIVPQFKNGKWKTKKMEMLCNFLVYIKECIEQPGSGIKESEVVHLLKDTIVLVTNKGRVLPSKEVIHFSSSYLPSPDLEKLFPDVKWTVVKGDYLKKSKSREAISSWVRFLKKLGVKARIHVQRINVKINEDSIEWNNLHDSQWSRLPECDYTLRDWQSEEFERIVKSVAHMPSHYQHTQMKRLAELLDESWDIEYKHYLEAQVFDENNEKYLDATTASSFHQFIVQQAWLPPADNSSVMESKSLYSGQELFDSTRQIQSLLHTHVPYIGANLKNQDFVNCLRVRRSVTLDDLTGYLLKWAKQSAENDTPFQTSVEHMSRVYVYLKEESEGCGNRYNYVAESSEPRNLIDAFREEKLIFVPDKYQESSITEIVSGRFHSIHSVCWSDHSTVLYTRQKYSLSLASNLPKVLSLYYGRQEDQQKLNVYNQLKQALIHFGVPETPRVGSYITLLKYIGTLSHHPEPEHIRDFTSIAFELVRLCNADSTVTADYIYSNLKNAKVFPTKSQVWVSLQECLLEDDDKNIAKCFDKSDQVFFIHWPDEIATKRSRRGQGWQQNIQNIANQKDKEEFIKMCKIAKLSSKVSPRVDFEGAASPVDKIKAQLSRWIVVIQRFIVANCNELYEQLQKDGIRNKLSTLQVFSVMRLSCRYFIEHRNSRIASPKAIDKACEYCYDGETSTIYISADKIEKHGVLLPALMKLFTHSASEDDSDILKSFLRNLLLDCPVTDEDLDDFMSEQDNIPDLLEDELVWEIPLPKHECYNDESTTEEEEDSASEDDERNNALDAESKSNGVPEEEKRLTCWPPRSAVDPSPSKSGSHNKHFPEIPSDVSFAMPPSSTELIAGLAKDTKPLSMSLGMPLRDKQELPKVEAEQTRDRAHQSSTSTNISQQRDNIPGRVEPSLADAPTPNSAEVCNSANEQGPTDRQTMSRKISDEPAPSSHVQSGDVCKKRSSTSENVEWKATKRARIDVELVDIQHVVESVQSTSNVPLIEMLDTPSTNDEEFRLQIGRWGEQYVYCVLKRIGRLPDGSQIKSVQWINKDEETDKPYDIVVQVEADDLVQESKCIYIEVKSTASDKKDFVGISWNQLKFAESHGDNFHLYRVYNAGRVQSRLCMLKNLYEYIRFHHVKFFFEL